MDNLIAVVVVLGLLLVFELYNEKRRYNEFIKKLEEEFGKLSDETYTDVKFANIKHLYENKKREGFVIDDITWNDLDMDELYKMINNTSSSIGMEYLYNLLREPCFDLEELKRRDELIELLENDKDVRKELQISLSCIGKKEITSVFGYMEEVFQAESKSVAGHIIQGILVFVFAGMIFMNSKYAIGLLLGIIFYNIISYYVYKAKIDKYLDFFALMVRVSHACKKLFSCKNNTIMQYNKKIMKADDIIKKVNRCSVVLSQSSVTGSISDMLMDYIKMIFHLDIIMFYSLLKQIKSEKEEIATLFDTLGYLDSMLSAASYRKYLDFYCKPEIDITAKKPFINVKEIYHPFIKDPVCNTLSTDKPVLITGSNASGKSTFIKTLAINAILSQTIYTCLCERYNSSRLKVYSSMSLRDNLFSQDSYYMAEIKSLKRIVDADKNDIPVICFVDEVLRGTNTLERVAASAQILDNLGKQNTLCFAATHDIELTNILKKTYDCYHFEENVIDDDVVFDYKLKEGPSNTRNAIKLLSVIGYDRNIIKKAEDMTVKFIDNGIWDVI